MTEEDSPSKRLVRALRREPVDRPPVWLMRQAGRYLPEYRKIRSGAKNFLDLCYRPDLAAEVTIQPLRRFDLDAAIIFSDILVIPDAAGCSVDFVEGRGPVLSTVRDGKEIDALDFENVVEHLQPVYEAIGQVRSVLVPEKALLGFCGAPWTVASYMVEGGSSREFSTIRKWAIEAPETLQLLFDGLERALTDHLIAQIEAGADAVQIFDSWAGILAETEFDRWSLGPITRICQAVKAAHPETPIIAFPRLAGVRYQKFVDIAAIDAVSLDQTVPCAWVAKNLQDKIAVQGNLDPVFLLAGGDQMDREIKRIMELLGANPGFVFNLGHGVIKETPPAHVERLCRLVVAQSGRD